MLEGSHGMARDADAAVALLEEKVQNCDAEAMWMLGVCCEFGLGTEQDVARAEKLYKRAAELGSSPARLLTGKLKNKNGRGSTQMDLGSLATNKTNNTKNTRIKRTSLWVTTNDGQRICAEPREQLF